MARRADDFPGPAFDPAIPADQQRLLRANRQRLRAHGSPPPRKRTRWRDKPVDTVGLLIACWIVAAVAWLIVGGIAGALFGPLGGLVGLIGAPVALGAPIWYVGRLAGEKPAERALRLYHGRYLRPQEFDTTSGALLARAQRAIDTVLESEVHKAGLIDSEANSVILPRYLWELSQILHDQTQLRKEQHAATQGIMTDELRAVLEPQVEALRRSVATVTSRVERLEEYAHRVRIAESAYRARVLMASNDKYRDLLSRTDDHDAISRLNTGVDEAEATLRASLQAAVHAGETLSLPSERQG